MRSTLSVQIPKVVVFGLKSVVSYTIIHMKIQQYANNKYSFEPALAQSGTEEVTNDTPMMIWYHLASDINRSTAQFDFDYKWKSSLFSCLLKLDQNVVI